MGAVRHRTLPRSSSTLPFLQLHGEGWHSLENKCEEVCRRGEDGPLDSAGMLQWQRVAGVAEEICCIDPCRSQVHAMGCDRWIRVESEGLFPIRSVQSLQGNQATRLQEGRA